MATCVECKTALGARITLCRRCAKCHFSLQRTSQNMIEVASSMVVSLKRICKDCNNPMCYYCDCAIERWLGTETKICNYKECHCIECDCENCDYVRKYNEGYSKGRDIFIFDAKNFVEIEKFYNEIIISSGYGSNRDKAIFKLGVLGGWHDTIENFALDTLDKACALDKACTPDTPDEACTPDTPDTSDKPKCINCKSIIEDISSVSSVEAGYKIRCVNCHIDIHKNAHERYEGYDACIVIFDRNCNDCRNAICNNCDKTVEKLGTIKSCSCEKCICKDCSCKNCYYVKGFNKGFSRGTYIFHIEPKDNTELETICYNIINGRNYNSREECYSYRRGVLNGWYHAIQSMEESLLCTRIAQNQV